MQATITDAGPCRKKMEIELDADKIKESYDEALTELRRESQIKGFRKGHAPRERVEKQFGKAILEDLKQKLISDAAAEAIKENDLDVLDLAAPIDMEALEVKIGEPLSFALEVEVAPEIKLPDYKKLAITVPPGGVTDEEIEKGIEGIRRQAADIKPVEGGTVEAKDHVIADFTLEVDGEVIAEQTEASLELSEIVVIGLPVSFEPGKLVGMKSEKSKTFKGVEVDNFSPLREHRGKKATLKVKVHEIRRAELPDLDDELAKRLGLDSIDALKERVKESMTGQKAAEQRRNRDQAIIAKLIELTSFDIPQGVLDKMSSDYAQRHVSMLSQYGLDQGSIMEQSSRITEVSRAAGEEDMRKMFILQEVAKEEKIEVTDEDLDTGIIEMAGPTGNPHELREKLEKSGRIGEVRSQLLERKVLDFLAERADITESAEAAAESSGGGSKAKKTKKTSKKADSGKGEKAEKPKKVKKAKKAKKAKQSKKSDEEKSE